MIATSFELYKPDGIDYGGEWRVYFDGLRYSFAESPGKRKRLVAWIEANISGECGQHWRISSYSLPAYAAFIKESDAMLCYLAHK